MLDQQFRHRRMTADTRRRMAALGLARTARYALRPIAAPVLVSAAPGGTPITGQTARVGRVNYRKLGVYGVKVSEIGLGSWLTYGGSVAEEHATACIHPAFELGVNFFDTANVYRRGAAEEVTGRALKSFRRDDYVLATKVYFPMGDGPNDRGLSRKHIMEQCHASLRRLGVDYVDLYQCHRPDETVPLEETLRALDDIVTQGKALYVGVSMWPAELLDEAYRLHEKWNLDPIASNQPEYSMLHRDIEDDVIPV